MRAVACTAHLCARAPAEQLSIFCGPQVREGQTWLEFAEWVFMRHISRLLQLHRRVVIAFDNYGEVPVFKSIEQLKRVSNKGVFAYRVGDELGTGPPPPHVWAQALLNRDLKTAVISRICSILLNKFAPQQAQSELIVDYVDTIRVRFEDGKRKHELLESHAHLGESDIKFMRYGSLFGDILVESVDSDVLLIAMLQLQRTEFKHRVYVRRYATRSIDDAPAAGRKRPAEANAKKGTGGNAAPRRGREYEIVDVCVLLQLLHGAVRQSVGPEVALPAHHITHIIVVLALLTGSDYNRQLPLVGPRHLWEQLGELVPMLQMSSNAGTSEPELSIDPELWLDVFMKHVYCQKFAKHVRGLREDATFADTIDALRASALADRTKALLPRPEQAACTLRNILWVLEYWKLENASPVCAEAGQHGFLVCNGKVRFADF